VVTGVTRGYLLWPSWEVSACRSNWYAMIAANRDYFLGRHRGTRADKPPRYAAIDAHASTIENANAAAAFQRLLSEPKHHGPIGLTYALGDLQSTLLRCRLPWQSICQLLLVEISSPLQPSPNDEVMLRTLENAAEWTPPQSSCL
jgi:hypothetical protein